MKLKGIYHPPGDKSISHRAVMFGALAEGKSTYAHFLEAEDCLCTLRAFQSLGVSVKVEKGTLEIQGVGLRGLQPAKGVLDLGNSGTSLRLMLGILAGQSFETTLTGDASLCARPMKRVTDPLRQMGARIQGKEDANFVPLTVQGGALHGIDYENQLRSAQVKSALLLAGLYAEGRTRVREAAGPRDHTERFLEASGARFRREGDWLITEKTDKLKPLKAEIPGDLSSAAFFIAGAAMTPGSDLTVEKVSLNPTRTGCLEVLKRMGAQIQVRQTQDRPEPMGTIQVKGGLLQATSIGGGEIPALIDELPVLMTALALAEGESTIIGAAELRVKETDRIQSMVTNLNALGARLEERPDGCVIQGVGRLQGGKVRSFGDHRTAMSLAVAGLRSEGKIEIDDAACVGTSYPAFFEDFEALK